MQITLPYPHTNLKSFRDTAVYPSLHQAQALSFSLDVLCIEIAFPLNYESLSSWWVKYIRRYPTCLHGLPQSTKDQIHYLYE